MAAVLRAVGPWVLVAGWCGVAVAQHASVVDTVHNLSVSGPGSVRAASETEVCKFCHIPHNSVAATPLWGHELSTAHYEMPESRSESRSVVSNQPDGSSRLCLSCHDGTVALGKIAGSGEIRMSGSSRLMRGTRGYLGTDLSGSHPISFVVRGELRPEDETGDMLLRPLSEITRDEKVRLDVQGKMQCTTCHDPHSDRYYVEGLVPRFWVEPRVEGLCLRCHKLR
jgi:hypothetical protein